MGLNSLQEYATKLWQDIKGNFTIAEQVGLLTWCKVVGHHLLWVAGNVTAIWVQAQEDSYIGAFDNFAPSA